MISKKQIPEILVVSKRIDNLRGFTLVEMLLVLVILAVSTAGVTVSLKGRQGRHVLKTSSQDLAQAISYAASEASMRGRPHRVVFYGGNSYRVEKQALDSVNEFVPVTGMPGRTKVLEGSVRISGFYELDGQVMFSTPESILFDQTTSSFSGQIGLCGQSNQEVKIIVNGLSGQVDISE